MSQVLKRSEPRMKVTKRNDKEYENFINDPLTFSLDEILNVLGPRHEKI